ncbi:transmembrane protein, putative [Medicago truncatula]|uniref:Transmembrane protein, putative n=1 Tax=Medicago truncatula TaxID=3880 RepID=G7INN2_MEDTR|nr:transmembrane protein, putative [Medicago truncatula]
MSQLCHGAKLVWSTLKRRGLAGHDSILYDYAHDLAGDNMWLKEEMDRYGLLLRLFFGRFSAPGISVCLNLLNTLFSRFMLMY